MANKFLLHNLLLCIFLLAISQCDDSSVNFERTNVNDPKSKNFTPDIDSLRYAFSGKNIRLQWADDSEFNEGFLIEKSLDVSEPFVALDTLPDAERYTFMDSSQIFGDNMRYRVRSFTNSSDDQIILADTLKNKFVVNITYNSVSITPIPEETRYFLNTRFSLNISEKFDQIHDVDGLLITEWLPKTDEKMTRILGLNNKSDQELRVFRTEWLPYKTVGFNRQIEVEPFLDSRDGNRIFIDSLTFNFNGNRPQIIKYRAIADDSLELIWEDKSNFEDGYQIDLTVGTLAPVHITKTGPNVTRLVFHQTLERFQKYTAIIHGFTETSRSDTVENRRNFNVRTPVLKAIPNGQESIIVEKEVPFGTNLDLFYKRFDIEITLEPLTPGAKRITKILPARVNSTVINQLDRNLEYQLKSKFNLSKINNQGVLTTTPNSIIIEDSIRIPDVYDIAGADLKDNILTLVNNNEGDFVDVAKYDLSTNERIFNTSYSVNSPVNQNNLKIKGNSLFVRDYETDTGNTTISKFDMETGRIEKSPERSQINFFQPISSEVVIIDSQANNGERIVIVWDFSQGKEVQRFLLDFPKSEIWRVKKNPVNNDLLFYAGRFIDIFNQDFSFKKRIVLPNNIRLNNRRQHLGKVKADGKQVLIFGEQDIYELNLETDQMTPINVNGVVDIKAVKYLTEQKLLVVSESSGTRTFILYDRKTDKTLSTLFMENNGIVRVTSDKKNFLQITRIFGNSNNQFIIEFGFDRSWTLDSEGI